MTVSSAPCSLDRLINNWSHAAKVDAEIACPADVPVLKTSGRQEIHSRISVTKTPSDGGKAEALPRPEQFDHLGPVAEDQVRQSRPMGTGNQACLLEQLNLVDD